jgi:hypothetical protein
MSGMVFPGSALSGDSPRPAGYWHAIRATPDLYTGETLNIGVCVVSAAGSRHAKVIDEPGRLSCLYSEESADAVVMLAEVAAALSRTGRDPREASPNVFVGESVPFFDLELTRFSGHLILCL